MTPESGASWSLSPRSSGPDSASATEVVGRDDPVRFVDVGGLASGGASLEEVRRRANATTKTARSREAEFIEFFNRHERRLRGFIARRGMRDTDAEEVFLAAMASAWARLGDFDDADALGWLCGVARGLISNSRRGVARRKRLFDRFAAQRHPLTVDLNHSQISVEERHALSAALAALSPAEQEVLALAVWDGLTHGEIALTLGITAGAARERLSRARAKLRESYQRTSEER
jgi:RNA polymerase sigma factor (sigma-70 family)